MALLTGLAFFTMFIRVPRRRRRDGPRRRLVIRGRRRRSSRQRTPHSQPGLEHPGAVAAAARASGFAGSPALLSLAVPPRFLPADARARRPHSSGAAGLTATLVSHAAASGDLGNVAVDFSTSRDLHLVGVVRRVRVPRDAIGAKRRPATARARRLALPLTALVAVA